MRSILLAAAQNSWLRDHAARFPFVRRSVSRFMPGEQLDDALAAARVLRSKGIGSVFTHLGENIRDRAEASQITEHYLDVLARIHHSGLTTEISVKLTQLGLDLSPEFCFNNLKTIIARESPESTVWIDMEASNYVDATLDLYRRALNSYPNVGICLQAYLRRTNRDVEALLPSLPSIRLVKGAYNEPAEIAFLQKRHVDENFFVLAQRMLLAKAQGRCRRAAFGTHDTTLIRRISDFAATQGIAKSDLEVQMLYGIQRGAQERLAKQGCRSVVLVAYGTFWYAWFVRRLAERPANIWFMIRNVFAS
jgi:proline dehydrogenase